MKKLFKEITIPSMTVSNKDWGPYSRLVEAAGEICQFLKEKTDQEVIEKINQLSSLNYQRKDYTGQVEIDYHQRDSENSHFEVAFQLIGKNKKITLSLEELKQDLG